MRRPARAEAPPPGARPPALARSSRRALLLLLLLAGLVAAGQAARRALGFELDPGSVQHWVQAFGWRAPLAYLALITFRHVLVLPSTLVLAVGGLCFGTLLGGALGALGLLLGGSFEFGLVRSARPAWLLDRAWRHGGSVMRAVERGAPAAVALSAAVPPLPMTAFYCAAALTGIPFASFLLAAGAGSLVRAFGLAYFGAGLLADEPARALAGYAALLLLVALPLLHPALRARLFPPTPEAGATASPQGAQRGAAERRPETASPQGAQRGAAERRPRD